jgi:hypothetical protein
MTPTSSHRIILPDRLDLSLVREGPESGDWAWDTQARELIVEATRPIVHAEPAALAALAAWANYQRAKGRELHIHDSMKSPYAWEFGILQALSGRASTQGTSVNYLPPTVIPSTEANPALFARLGPLLHSLSGEQKNVVLHCLAEMLRNVHEHADCPRGAVVCCSHFPNSDRLSLAIVDTGQGVPRNIRLRHGMAISDDRAIEMATEFGISGATSSRDNNAGLGLFIARSTTWDTGGLFTLVSGEGFVRNGQGEEVVRGKPRAAWQGTVVALSFKPSQSLSAWTRNDTLMRRTNLTKPKVQPVRWGPPPPGSRQITITPVAAELIEDKEKAKTLRDKELIPELEAGRPVGIDLRSARLITHSFIHALLYKAFSVLGERARTLLYIQAEERRVKDVIRIVAWYAQEERKTPEAAPLSAPE